MNRRIARKNKPPTRGEIADKLTRESLLVPMSNPEINDPWRDTGIFRTYDQFGNEINKPW